MPSSTVIKRRIVFTSLVVACIYYALDLSLNIHKEKSFNKSKKYARPTPMVETNLTKKSIREINVNCSSHRYDPVDWTLHLLEKKDQDHVSCAEKRNCLVKANLVKTLIHPNGTEQNLGCRNDTAECKEKPHHDEMYNVRVNMPPCCRAKLIKIYHNFNGELEQQNISHFLMFGGLLGYVRNKHMVSYDTDLDMFIDHEVWKQPLLKNILQKLRTAHGHNHELKDNGEKLKIYYSASNNNSIDVWPFKVITDFRQRSWVHIPHYFSVNQPLANIFPLRRVLFEGSWTNIPRKPDEVLNLQYGRGNWEYELSCKHVDKMGQCISEKHRIRTIYAGDPSIKYLLLFLLSFITLMTSIMCLLIKCSNSSPHRR